MSEKINLTPMSLEAIKEKVNAIKAGSFHKITILDGAPIDLGSDIFYATETMQVRFKINYGVLPEVILKRAIALAATPRDVARCREAYEKLKPLRKALVAKTALEKLEQKEKLVAAETKIVAEDCDYDDEKDRLPDCPSIVNCKNGQQTLTCYKAFRSNIKNTKGGFEIYEVPTKTRWFLQNKKTGSIIEIDPKKHPEKKEAIEKAIAVLVAKGRYKVKKKKGGESLVYTPRVTNILNIE